MPHFAQGVLKFQSDVFPDMQDLFDKLDEGQSPDVLFITCADSRIEPSTITQTKPGDIFVCRNAGNIVPPYSDVADGMSASIEFAVTALKVPHIVICGHSQCGAMAGALAPDGLGSLPHVAQWVQHADGAVDKIKAQTTDGSQPETLSKLIEENVCLQLEHLRTHPSVAARLEAGDLELHGWVYDIKTGGVKVFSAQRDAFVDIGEAYSVT